ncbi:MAG: hypothetical protein ACREMH_01865 [Gemmatimonadales bacterium]
MAQPGLIDDERIKQLYARRVAERDRPGGPGCVSPEAILALVRREGREQERLATLDHVMSCAACHREYEWLGAVDRAVVEAEPSVERRRSWQFMRPLALAASLLVAVGAVLVVRRMVTDGPEPLRGNGADIELVGPSAEVSVDAPIAFVWRRLDGVSRYVLEVQRTDGSVVFTETTGDTTVTLPDPAGVLPEGDYRWWVREVTDGSEPRASSFRPLRPRR